MAEAIPAPTSFPAPPPFHPHQCTRRFRGFGTSVAAAFFLTGFFYGNYLRHHDYKVRRHWLFEDRAQLRWDEDEIDVYQRENDELWKLLQEANAQLDAFKQKYEPHLIPKKEEGVTTEHKHPLSDDPDLQDFYDFFDNEF